MTQHAERLLYGIAIVAGVLGAVLLAMGLFAWIAAMGIVVPTVVILTALAIAYAVGWALDPSR